MHSGQRAVGRVSAGQRGADELALTELSKMTGGVRDACIDQVLARRAFNILPQPPSTGELASSSDACAYAVRRPAERTWHEEERDAGKRPAEQTWPWRFRKQVPAEQTWSWP